LEWGKYERNLEDLVASGGESKALENRPEIDGVEWLWNAYIELSTCRPVGFGFAPIPWTAIQLYIAVNKLNGEDEELLNHCISTLDGIQQEHSNKDK